MNGMRWERYIGGGIFGERYTRRLSLGRYSVIAICMQSYLPVLIYVRITCVPSLFTTLPARSLRCLWCLRDLRTYK
jgi:hypothetical protein